jgi:AbrB family looped-hinge helix DNA binding protein
VGNPLVATKFSFTLKYLYVILFKSLIFQGGPMPNIMKISPQGQIRIPKKIMQSLGILKGDYFEMDVEENQIVLKPRKLIDPSQGWYWTKEWQKMEVEVDEEIEKDQLSPKFQTADEGKKWLKE